MVKEREKKMKTIPIISPIVMFFVHLFLAHLVGTTKRNVVRCRKKLNRRKSSSIVMDLDLDFRVLMFMDFGLLGFTVLIYGIISLLS